MSEGQALEEILGIERGLLASWGHRMSKGQSVGTKMPLQESRP
jgi:hypothetical protein